MTFGLSLFAALQAALGYLFFEWQRLSSDFHLQIVSLLEARACERSSPGHMRIASVPNGVSRKGLAWIEMLK